ncbi:SIR2 family NAD-dependent protein deacylase [Dictyobacter aurantiacus]|uniref:NAD-dependent protein deacylase n=1 Tax=Dictyobacter aurantiacus TaxID=1936993 RepID=A0A401ZGV1_9CHLR|nr:NAD-dependent deacylase [Dictyobacter aurantiacus]GCE06066.1 NAD-dependent protein deacylase [Dictyobacter aurantiacus]
MSNYQQSEMAFPVGLLETLRGARHVAVLTGAGISAESGVPTFRDVMTGLWAQYDPQELATPQAFMKNPKLVWEWYDWRRKLVSQVAPNAGHYALAEMERHVPLLTLITQNVDSLHQQAGSTRVLELHGNIHRVKCFKEDTVIEQWEKNGEVPPRCPNCGGMLRPDVVWFGESLPEQPFNEAALAALHCDVFLSIGTSGLVEPAASLPLVALRRNARVVLVNPEETPLLREDVDFLRGPAGAVLPALVHATWASGTDE